MIEVKIYISILIIVAIIFLVWFARKMFKPVLKMHKAGSGKRTRFIVETSDNGYEYYKDKVEKWLKNYGYKRKNNGYILKYHKNGNIFKFGFNYYQEANNMIIETWLNVLGSEYPLTEKVYEKSKNEKTILDAVTKKESDVEINNILVGQQGKNEYLDFLKTLIIFEKNIKETNSSTLLKNIDLSKNNEIKKEKKDNKMLVIKILGISIAITAVIYLLVFFISGDYKKPRPSKEDKKEALNIIKKAHPTFKLTDSSYYVSGGNKNTYSGIKNYGKFKTNSKDDYYLVYTFYGTMNTPEKDKDKVVVFMKKNSYDSSGWNSRICQNKSGSKCWNLNFDN